MSEALSTTVLCDEIGVDRQSVGVVADGAVDVEARDEEENNWQEGTRTGAEESTAGMEVAGINAFGESGEMCIS